MEAVSGRQAGAFALLVNDHVAEVYVNADSARGGTVPATEESP